MNLSSHNGPPNSKKQCLSKATGTDAQTQTNVTLRSTTPVGLADDTTLEAEISMSIPGVTEFMEKIGNTLSSGVVVCGGIQWNIDVSPVKDNSVGGDGDEFLACFLRGDAPGTWTACVKHVATIISHIDGAADYEHRCAVATYSSVSKEVSWGVRKFIPKKELLDPHNGYVSGDTVSIRLTLTLSNTRGTPFEVFRDAHAFPSDVKLIVEGESFYANKGYLTVVSKYFEKLFSGRFVEGCMEEVELGDVKAADFHLFLQVIYPTQLQLSDLNVLQVTRLANYFDVVRVLTACVDYLKATNNVPLCDKLKLSEELMLDRLKEKLIASMTVADAKQVANDAGCKDLSVETMVAILKKVTS